MSGFEQKLPHCLSRSCLMHLDVNNRKWKPKFWSIFSYFFLSQTQMSSVYSRNKSISLGVPIVSEGNIYFWKISLLLMHKPWGSNRMSTNIHWHPSALFLYLSRRNNHSHNNQNASTNILVLRTIIICQLQYCFLLPLTSSKLNKGVIIELKDPKTTLPIQTVPKLYIS